MGRNDASTGVADSLHRMTTFPELTARRLAADPGRPFLTYYDDGTGERTELSVTTFANWVAKTANLLADELLLDPGAVVDLRLPPHWLGPVFLGAAWSAGLVVADGHDPTADLVVTGPQYDEPVGAERLACSLTPFATRITDPLPEGVQDFGLLWPGQGDVFVPVEPVQHDDLHPSDDRVLTDLNPVTPEGRRVLLDHLAGAGSLVLLGGDPQAHQWERHAHDERTTAAQRAG
jgi:uncharacterized protein (TIGR03089 family)